MISTLTTKMPTPFTNYLQPINLNPITRLVSDNKYHKIANYPAKYDFLIKTI